MKKFLALLLALVMVFALAACGEADAPASDAPMRPRPMTATAEKGASVPFSSADSVMEVSVSSIDQVPVASHCIRSRRPRAQTPASAAFSARLKTLVGGYSTGGPIWNSPAKM